MREKPSGRREMELFGRSLSVVVDVLDPDVVVLGGGVANLDAS